VLSFERECSLKQSHSVIIVEDDVEIANRLARLIESADTLELLHQCGNVSEGLKVLIELNPDILLTDLGLPDGSGIDIIKAIKTNNLDTEAMVISGFQDEYIVFEALEAGAKSYLLKYDESQSIIGSIKAMMEGGAPMSPVIARLMLQRFQSPAVNSELMLEVLTEQQLKILKYISQGFSSKEIGEKCDISYYTVTTHIKNIYNKLQVNSRAEAIHEAIKQGLIH